MHFLEATDIGHLMINYDGKVRKERKQEETSVNQYWPKVCGEIYKSIFTTIFSMAL